MIEHIIDDAFGCGRVDKYIARLLPGMPKGLLYKQLRNKNITLNGHKISGAEQVKSGDILKLYLSDDTYKAFSEGHSLIQENMPSGSTKSAAVAEDALTYYAANRSLADIIYENDHILVIDKPSGILSQKSKSDDHSLNEWMIGYLLSEGKINEKDMLKYKPSVLNRLDRNTSGLVLAGKTYKAANLISKALGNRTVHKFYKALVWGDCEGLDGVHEAYLSKNSLTNIVNIATESVNATERDKYAKIVTGVRIIDAVNTSDSEPQSVLEIELITGKSHQIRAHLASLGHPIVGDPKYGNRILDKKHGYSSSDGQFLHAYKIVFDKDLINGLNLDKDCIVSEPGF